MNPDQFWLIIDAAHDASGGSMDLKCDLLKITLRGLGEAELHGFIDQFDAHYAKTYTWPLWGAAYVINGGCSDDCFSDFRSTLISQGRKAYEAALADPESLADVTVSDAEDFCYEGFHYAINDIAEEKLGEIPPSKHLSPADPSGEEWQEDDLSKLYPRLSEKYAF